MWNIFFMHVVRALVVSCALVTYQCELRSGGIGVWLFRVRVAETERGAKFSAFQGYQTRCES
jgi:hypothetical protein